MEVYKNKKFSVITKIIFIFQLHLSKMSDMRHCRANAVLKLRHGKSRTADIILCSTAVSVVLTGIDKKFDGACLVTRQCIRHTLLLLVIKLIFCNINPLNSVPH